jgi:hypothetical protein
VNSGEMDREDAQVLHRFYDKYGLDEVLKELYSSLAITQSLSRQVSLNQALIERVNRDEPRLRQVLRGLGLEVKQ